jgi:hypothetical protein
VVVAEGLTVILSSVDPVFQLYDWAPDARRLMDPPAQIIGLAGEICKLGAGSTVITEVATSEHPRALVPVTVKLVLDAGLMVITGLVDPVLQA